MDYKKAFYSKLEDCYLGVKIKDFHKGNIAKSGFSNLLKIKEQYFAHIKAYLDSQIEGEPQSHDIYNKLFTFFDSYLNESGTPFFNDTPIYKNIYAKAYSNSKDTSLFYRTQNLYYVKSDILYQSLTLNDEQENYEVIFDASEYRQNADNTKNKVIFKLDSISCNEFAKADEETPNQISIKVINQKDLFPELNNVFKQNSSEFSEDFLKILKQKKLKFNEENLKKIFRSYKKQSEIDFFIHKNAKAFLQEQFNLWMFHYLYQESEIQEWNPDIIAHLQRIKNIAYEVIKLIGDFENELKAVWLKPKFAKKVEYVFSVDTIFQHANNANALLKSITNDKGFETQIKEWQELNLIDKTFKKEDLLANDKYRFLPLDTKHFAKEAKYKTLSSFENLESILLDYHLGSGTTLAVAQKLGRKWLGRKWLGVEMGEHFYNVVIPRLKKTIAGFQSGISKECDYKGGGAFRYYELESYEEALSHCEYVLSFCHSKSSLCHTEALAEVSQQGNKRDISASPQYDNEIYKGKNYAKAEVILDYRKSRKLIDKLNKGESVCLDMRTEYREDFDIFHTMANLMGWKIKRLFLDSNGIESCEFDNGEILNLDSLDLAKYPKLKNLIWWE